MAKLLSYYSLCPINDVREFLGLSRDVDTGCVINTLGRNIIQVVKVGYPLKLPLLIVRHIKLILFSLVEQSKTPTQLDFARPADQQSGLRFPLGTVRGRVRESPGSLLEPRSVRHQQSEEVEVLPKHS